MTARKTSTDLRKEWPLVDRMDGRIEIICPHGVGHPSRVLSGARWVSSWMGVHGCDGCCGLAAFALAEMAHATVLGIEYPVKVVTVCPPHTFDRDGDLGVETCTKCGLKRGEVAAEGKATQPGRGEG